LAAILSSPVTGTNTTSTAMTTKCKSGLTELDLTRNRITDEGAVALAQVLTNDNHNNNNSLVKLSLAWNRWTMAVGLQAFVDRLPQYTRLQALNLDHPDICPSLTMYQQVVDGMEGNLQGNGSKNYALTFLSIGCESSGVLSSDDGASTSSGSSSSSLSYNERSAVLDELRFVWQEPAYSEAAHKLSCLLHLNK
jgi:hypothetical protein